MMNKRVLAEYSLVETLLGALHRNLRGNA